MGIAGSSRFASKFDGHETAEFDIANPAIAVNLDACIACGACVRACREVQVNDVIGMADRGGHTIPVFDMHDPMGAVDLRDLRRVRAGLPDRRAVREEPDGQGGQDARGGRIRQGRQFALSLLRRRLPDARRRQGQPDRPDRRPQRLRQRKPPVRQGPLRFRLCDVARAADQAPDPARRCAEVGRGRPARRRSADRLPRGHLGGGAGARRQRPEEDPRPQHGGRSLAGFGSAKGSNEEAYLFQKLVRQGFGTNNVDHCTRLCHASSVAALMEGVGSGAVSAPFTDALKAECIMVIGARPTTNHPVAATFFKQAAKRGAKLIVIDPRGQDLMRHATPFAAVPRRQRRRPAELRSCTPSSRRSSTTSSTSRPTCRASRR